MRDDASKQLPAPPAHSDLCDVQLLGTHVVTVGSARSMAVCTRRAWKQPCSSRAPHLDSDQEGKSVDCKAASQHHLRVSLPNKSPPWPLPLCEIAPRATSPPQARQRLGLRWECEHGRAAFLTTQPPNPARPGCLDPAFRTTRLPLHISKTRIGIASERRWHS